MEPKRRLPLVSSTPEADGTPPRPPWQWVMFGAFAMFVVWLPLSALVAYAARWGGSALVFAASSALALAGGALAGGFLVGKWGGGPVGVREAALSGLVASLGGVVASWLTFGMEPSSLAAVVIAVPAAAVGGKLGLAER